LNAAPGFKPFKRFHIDQAVAFKRTLSAEKNARTGAPLAKATVDGTLRAVKGFIVWLAGQQGYKSRIAYADAEYFNLNAKDARIAHTTRNAIYPSLEQCQHAFGLMPSATLIDQRNKALFAFLMLTGARDGAIASLRLHHIDLVQGCVFQDAREVRTKAAKTFTTWFLPVGDDYRSTFVQWVETLRKEQLFGPNDALFPKPLIRVIDGAFAVSGLDREPYASASAIREVIKTAFTNAGLPPYAPHSFRKTLVKFGDQLCRTREQFKAWSQNMGHDSVVTTLSAYCPVSSERQAELLRGLA
jgi:integrase/recombinase XerD